MMEFPISIKMLHMMIRIKIRIKIKKKGIVKIKDLYLLIVEM